MKFQDECDERLNEELNSMIEEYLKEIERLHGNPNEILLEHFRNSEPSNTRNSAFRHMLNEIKTL